MSTMKPQSGMAMGARPGEPDPGEWRHVPAARIHFLPEDRAWIAARIQEVLATGQLTLGRYGTQFEEAFARFCGTRYAIAVNSGTSALEIILRSLGVTGKDVLVSTNTFFATAAAIVHAGGRPIFVDMDPESFAISPDDAARKMTSNTVGMIVVHIGGIVSPHMPTLQEWTRTQGIWLVEDAAHAHGSAYGGRMAGSFGVAGAFSFYPTKVMTSAEGGMIVTNNAHLAEEARLYRDQGKAGFTRNLHVHMGYNWRMSEPHAIIGLKHLERLPTMIAERQRIAALFDDELTHCRTLSILAMPAGEVCNYYKYIAVLKRRMDRKALKTLLHERYGVSLAGEVYEEPLHRQPVLAPYVNGPLPVAEDYCARHLCLPIYAGMEESEARHVVNALTEAIV